MNVNDLAEMEALRDELNRIRDDVRRYRDEARRYRTEARYMMLTAQMEAVYMPQEKAKWVTEGIPTPPGRYAYYGAGGDSYLLYQSGSGRGEYTAYLTTLEEAGFCRYYAGEWGKLAFACYYDDRAVINVTHAVSENILRVVVEARENSALPPSAPICDGVPGTAAPKLAVFGDHLYDFYNCGMGYIYHLSDGTFVVIDGGTAEPQEQLESFFGCLRELAGEGPIIISAWIITHAHEDHTQMLIRFSEQYADQLEVRRVIHNFPGTLMQLGGGFHGWCKQEVQRMEESMARFSPKPEFIRAHTGQRFDFPGLSVEMLFTLEDFKQPFFPDNFNATSLIFRVTAEGQTHMYLGDTDPTGCEAIVNRFGDALKSDVVQVAHHGYWGGTTEVYDAIQPEIVMWPCALVDPPNYPNPEPRISDPNFSRATREMIRKYARSVYMAWKGTDILSLPLDGVEGVTLMKADDPTIETK